MDRFRNRNKKTKRERDAKLEWVLHIASQAKAQNLVDEETG